MPYKTLSAYRRPHRKGEDSSDYKKSHNLLKDYEQYGRWKKVLGDKEMPETLAEFQEMKYNNSKKFEQLNNRYTFNNKFKTQEYLLELHEGKQGKHILGHNNYKQGKSVITIDLNEIRNIVNDKHGTGQIVITRKGVMTSKEVIKADKKIGYGIIDNEQIYTNYMTVHYSKDGYHVVPKVLEDKDG